MDYLKQFEQLDWNIDVVIDLDNKQVTLSYEQEKIILETDGIHDWYYPSIGGIPTAIDLSFDEEPTLTIYVFTKSMEEINSLNRSSLDFMCSDPVELKSIEIKGQML
ncbi:hypothetical protein [Vibrio harveyi]|uniref:hypothetical protein n=1 Tax=Vibrio harveyi TaxID=669 RepID=UPI003CF1A0F0